MLADYLTPATIRLRVGADGWPAALQQAGNLLVGAGACTPGYVAAMVEAVETLGPYIVLAPGLAFAHARPEAGALRLGASLVTLDPPVWFGAAENDPVAVVVAFCTCDDQGHIELLAELAHLLGDAQRHTRIRAAEDADEVLAVVRRAGQG